MARAKSSLRFLRLLFTPTLIFLVAALAAKPGGSKLVPLPIAQAGGPSVLQQVVNNTWDSPCHGNWKIVRTNKHPPGLDRLWIGYAYPYTCVVYVRPWLKGVRLCTTVQHEVGHLIGVGHSEDPNNIMFPTERRNSPACMKAYNAGMYDGGILHTEGKKISKRFLLTPHPQ